MTKKYEEPKYIDVKRDHDKNASQKEDAIQIIKKICDDQAFGVLSTQGTHGSYSSLISFSINEDYSKLVFATPINTKKIDQIKHTNGVSILIDNRNDNPHKINDIVGVTLTGKAHIVRKENQDQWIKLLTDKHEYLKGFAEADSTVIVMIDISKYYFVSSFQEVIEWIPDC